MAIRTPNLYDSLGLEVTATKAEIKKVINRTFRESHPDMNGGKTGPRYEIAQQARETLLNDSKRQEYDLEIGVQERSYASAPGQEGVNPFQAWQHEGFTRSYGANPYFEEEPEPTPQETWQDQGREVFDFQPERINVQFSSPPSPVDVYPKGESSEFPVWALSTMALGLFMGLAILLVGLGLNHPWLVGQSDDMAGKPELFFINALRCVMIILATLVIYISVFLVRWLMPARGSKGARVAGVIAAIIAWAACSTIGSLIGWILCPLAAVSAYFSVAWHTHSRAHLLTSKKCERTPVFGKPGAGLKNAPFDADSAQAGVKGEVASADHLRLLLSIPGTRIFHSLKGALQGDEDVDHVIVRDRTIILVDTKFWPSRHYSLGSSERGILVREMNGASSQERSITIPRAMESYRRMFPNCRVSAWVLIQPANGRDNFSVYAANDVPSDLGIGGPQETINTLGNYLLGQSQPRIDREVVTRLHSLVKS